MIRCTHRYTAHLFSEQLQQTNIDAEYQNPCTMQYMNNEQLKSERHLS